MNIFHRPFLPPYILDQLARSADAAVRQAAIDAIAMSAALRALRAALATMPIMAAIPSPTRAKERRIHDMNRKTFSLPGTIILREAEKKLVRDKAVREAYVHLGTTYDFYDRLFGRNSMDDNGMALIASVHFGRAYNNAFWNGEQMVFGDGDERIFLRFTRSLDVVAHELTHGVIAHASNLEYYGQPGALNEHFADVFGVLVKQWRFGHPVDAADWLIAAEIMGPKTKVKSIRTFKARKAYRDDPVFGTDPQPKHMRDIFEGVDDDGGVHINSGIPNHAFYRAALELGGKAWETLGPVWYKAMFRLRRRSDFREAARMTFDIAADEHGPRSGPAAAVRAGWKAVGLPVVPPRKKPGVGVK